MSSTSTTWTTDTNTKSGVVQIYSSNVSVLKILGSEAGDSILELFADEGDDNADKWRMWVNASDDDLHFSNYTSGAWGDILTIQDGGNVGIGTDTPSAYSSGAYQLVVYGAGDSGMTIASGATSDGSIFFADGTSGSSELMGYLQYDHDTNKMIIGTNNTTQIAIDSSGNVGIGDSAPSSKLELTGASGANCHITIRTAAVNQDAGIIFKEADVEVWRIQNDADGGTVGGSGEDNIFSIHDDDSVSVVLGQDDTSWGVVSDERAKENMVGLTDATKNLNTFRCVNYNFKYDIENGKDIKRIGLVAQDVYKKYPEVVKGTPDGNFQYTSKTDTESAKATGMMFVKYTELIPVLVKAIQELSAKVEALESNN